MSWGFSWTQISTEEKLWRRETNKSRVDSMCAGISASEESSWSTDQIPELSHLITLLITKNYLKKWSLETERCWTYCSRILQCARPQWKMLLDETYEPTALVWQVTMVKTNLTDVYLRGDETQAHASCLLDFLCQAARMSAVTVQSRAQVHNSVKAA